MAGIPPVPSVTDTETSPLAAAERYAGDNVYALSTTSAAAAPVAAALPYLGAFFDTTDAVSQVAPVVGTTIDRIA